MTFFLICIAAVLVVFVGYLVVQTRFPKIVEVVLETSKIPAGQELRIIQVTDLHNLSVPMAFLEKLKGTNPDLIAVTGDLINGTERNFDNVHRFVERLSEASEHLFFVSGNNEWEHKKYREYLKGLEQRGLVILNNASVAVSTGGIELNVVGVDDPSKRHDNL
ncbi:MAG: metallophosphoesterase, partial [Tumebacillaceae bacterium]